MTESKVHEFDAESVETIETKHGPVVIYKLKTGVRLAEMEVSTYEKIDGNISKWLDEQELNRLEWQRLQNDMYPGAVVEQEED